MHLTAPSILSTLLLLLPTTLLAQPTKSTNPASSPTISNVTIFSPPANYTVPRTLYARTLLLTQPCNKEAASASSASTNGNTLLATWENYGPNNDTNPYFPIYASHDGGATWSERSRVHDQVNGWGLRYQPFLYELPEAFGGYKAGTILLAGNSIPDDLSETQIDLYASTDKGYTWKFVSHIAHGGEAIPDNGLTPVWEPFLMMYKGQLVCYYSDQRDPLYGQKLVHQTTSDLLSWGEVVNDVAYPTYDFRPGMTTIAKLPNGEYILTYEFYGAPEAAFAVYYRISPSPLTFANATGQVIKVAGNSTTVPVSSPYVVWSPVGGKNGSIVVSCGTLGEVFVNQNLGQGEWESVPTAEGISYSRSLRVLDSGKKVLIVGGGVLGGTENEVTASVLEL